VPFPSFPLSGVNFHSDEPLEPRAQSPVYTDIPSCSSIIGRNACKESEANGRSAVIVLNSRFEALIEVERLRLKSFDSSVVEDCKKM